MGEAAALELQMELLEATAESHLTGLLEPFLFFFPPIPGQVGWRPEQGGVGNRK